MKITAHEEYGLRCVLRVAQHGIDEPISAEAIANMEGLSLSYAQKLLRQLADGEIIEAKRGPNGGYLLAEPLDSITLGDVMRQLGAMLEIEDFCETHTGKREVCANACECTIRPVWSHISDFLAQTMDAIPLAILVDDEQSVRNHLTELKPPAAGREEALSK